MKTITSVREMQAEAERLRLAGKRIAVVPTMGYLHEGHLSLMRRARELADVLVTTIFVNPTQFGPNEDFERYPRDMERDTELCARERTDIIFAPETKEMYPPGYATYVVNEGASSILEGAIRPGHFRGVTTIVTKLFLITKPHAAVFGQKDAQQAFIIRKMAADLNFDLHVEVAPIIREPDGLAMSSRNVYLSKQQRENATALSRSLKHAEALLGRGERSVPAIREEIARILHASSPTGIDYVAFIDPERFAEIERLEGTSVLIALAVRYGGTRLIDNSIVRL